MDKPELTVGPGAEMTNLLHAGQLGQDLGDGASATRARHAGFVLIRLQTKERSAVTAGREF